MTSQLFRRFAFSLCLAMLIPMVAAAEPKAQGGNTEPTIMFYNSFKVSSDVTEPWLKWMREIVIPLIDSSPGHVGGGFFIDAVHPGHYLMVMQWASWKDIEAWQARDIEMVHNTDPALLNALRGKIDAEPHQFEIKSIPRRRPALEQGKP
jgi:hypothetical protein